MSAAEVLLLDASFKQSPGVVYAVWLKTYFNQCDSLCDWHKRKRNKKLAIGTREILVVAQQWQLLRIHA